MSASDPGSESGRDRAALAREAGLGRLSLPSALRGARNRPPWAALPAALAVGAAVAAKRRGTSRQPAGQDVPVQAGTHR